MPAQQLDQSQDGHLPREPLPAGVDAFLTAEAEHSEKVDQPVPSTVLSSSLVTEDQRRAESDTQSPTHASQETRTVTTERKSVPAMLGDVTESSDCVQFASRSEFIQSSHTQLATESYRREMTSSSQRAAHGASGGDQRTTVSTEVQSRCLEVVESPTLQRLGSDLLPQSGSTLPSGVSAAHPLTSSGTVVSSVSFVYAKHYLPISGNFSRSDLL